MSSKGVKILEAIASIIVGVVAVLAIKSIFENDNSKIVSKKGRSILSDEDEMKKIDKQINISEENNLRQEIII